MAKAECSSSSGRAARGCHRFENRIYLVNTSAATDITGVTENPATQVEQHVGKELLWKDQLGCNLEGLCLGPALGNTRRSLLAIVDNNGIGTPNQSVGFVLDEAGGDARLPLIVGGAANVALVLGRVIYRLVR